MAQNNNKTQQKPNDQRSTVKNTNNEQYPKDKANTAKQVKQNQSQPKKK